MRDPLDLVHVSGGLLSLGIVSEALADAPRRPPFAAEAFPDAKGKVPSASEHDESVQAAFMLGSELYDEIAPLLATVDTPTVRERWLRPMLELLDLAPAYQRARLPSADGRDRFQITHLGWDGQDAPPLVLTAAKLDEPPERGARAPHDELQAYLNRVPARWGIAANGRELRLLRDFHHERLKAFVGFDIAAIFETRDFQAFRALYRLCHRSRFAPRGEEEKPPVEVLFEASQLEGVQIGRHLQRQVRVAIESLAEGLLTGELRALLDDPREGRGLYRELLLVVYRVLFLLFAEQRRMLPREGIYADTYSIAALARIAEARSAVGHHRDLWEGLKATFRMLGEGVQIGEERVYPYNGQLFDARRTARLEGQTCETRYVLEAVRALTHVHVGGVRQRVNYAELGVDELGSVYESLLNDTLRRAERPTRSDDRTVPAGGVYLAPLTTERKDLGAYYTPPALVDFVLQVSLDELIGERLDRAGGDARAREHALLDIRICDAACGSGAFLVGAVDRVALALARVRSGADKPREDELQRARRDVLGHCIYGVDKDVFAVELCKVALWIHCAVPDLPLSFLDHRIQHGDSLVGWPLLDEPGQIPAEAYTVPSKLRSGRRPEDARLRNFLDHARAQNDAALAGQQEIGKATPTPDIRVDFPAVLAEDERVPADVEKKTEAYRGYLASAAHRRFETAANLWTAAFFWSPDAGAVPPTSADYQRALEGSADPALAEAAARILDEFPAFHWPLRFPEIRARRGFDCFLGNPPWEQVKLQEQEWFGPRAPEIAAMTTAERQRAIERLLETNPLLHRQWLEAKSAYDRLAEYMRNCGRYAASGHEPNTYLLFAEAVHDMLRADGRAGMLLKSGVAIDKSGSNVFRKLLPRIIELHDHVNGGPTGSTLIFPAVAPVERFSLIALGAPRTNPELRVTMMNWNVEEAIARPRQNVTPGILCTLCPRTGTMTSFRTQEQLEVALAIHRRVRTLDFDDGGTNPWELKYAPLFHSSGKSAHFLKREQLEDDGWTLGKDKIFRRARAAEHRTEGQASLFDRTGADEIALPLYEGLLASR